MSQIIHLAKTKLTPEVVLHRTLTELKNIKAVVVLVQDKNGVWEIDYSNMSVGDLCCAEKWMSLEVADVLMGED